MARPKKRPPKPKWCPWEPASWASDPKVKKLSFHWRAVYFDILNDLMLDGEIEWDQESFESMYQNPAQPDQTQPMLAKLRGFFQVRDIDGLKMISHPIITEGRNRYYRAVKQRSNAGKAKKGWRKGAQTHDSAIDTNDTVAERELNGSLTEGERRPSPSLSSSLSTSLPGKTKDLHSEPNSKREKEAALGLAWVRSLSERDQAVVQEALVTVRATRKGSKIARAVMADILFQLSRFPETAVEACDIYRRDHSEKKENYLIGIARTQADEANRVSRARP